MTDKPARPSKRLHGNGPGWGGPAKGARTAREEPAPRFLPGNTASPPVPADAKARVRAMRDAMIAVYERIALDPDAAAMSQIVAADKWLDRHEGKPIARTVNLTPDDASLLDDGTLASIALGGDGATTH